MDKQDIVQLKRTLHMKATLAEYGLSSESAQAQENRGKAEEEPNRRRAEEEQRRQWKQEAETLKKDRERAEAQRKQQEQADALRKQQEQERERARARQAEEARRQQEQAQSRNAQKKQPQPARNNREESAAGRTLRGRKGKKGKSGLLWILIFLAVLAAIGYAAEEQRIPSFEELISPAAYGTGTGAEESSDARNGQTGAGYSAKSGSDAGEEGEFPFATPYEYGSGTARYGDRLCITNRIYQEDYVGEEQEIAVIPWPEEIGEERFQISWDHYSVSFTCHALDIRYAYETYEKSAEEYLRKKGLISSLGDAKRAETESGEVFYYIVTDEETEGFVTTDRKLSFTAVSDRAGKGVFTCTYERRYNSSQETVIALDSAGPEAGMALQSSLMEHSLLGSVSFVRGDLAGADGASPMAAVTLRDLSSGIEAVVSHGALRYHGIDGTEEWRETVYWNSFEEDSPRSTKVTYDGLKADSVEYTLQDTYYAKAEDYPVLSSLAQNASELIQDEVRTYTLNGREVRANLVHYLASFGTEYTEINAWIPLSEDVILTGQYKVAHYDFGDYPDYVEDVDTLRAHMDEIVTEMMGTDLTIRVP